MRPLQRAVGDYHVDRPQVEAQRCVEPSGTNCPSCLQVPSREFPGGPPLFCSEYVRTLPSWSPVRQGLVWRLLRGGAPLPIPNREVKPRRADDTAVKRGKVGRRPPLAGSVFHSLLFFCHFIIFFISSRLHVFF